MFKDMPPFPRDLGMLKLNLRKYNLTKQGQGPYTKWTQTKSADGNNFLAIGNDSIFAFMTTTVFDNL